MATRIATVLAKGSNAEVGAAVERALAEQLAGEEPVLIAVFASTSNDLGELCIALGKDRKAVVIGASTAGEFTEHGDAKGSVAVFALGGDEYRASAGIGDGLAADPGAAVGRALSGQPRAVPNFSHRTAITLLDPLAGNGEEAALLLAEQLGPDQPIAGGAAGDDLKMTQTIVACGARACSDAIVVAQIFSKRPLGIGIAHGHRALSAPLRVTRATGGTVHELDGRPAWDVWLERTRDSARARGIDVDALAPGAEGAFLLQFEAGLANLNDYKIRAPLARSADGSISFAAAIPEGSVIRITESDAGAQVESALRAADGARAALGGPVAGALVFDCICRNLILGERFGTAVRGIAERLGGAPVAGFETYGEVALSAGEMSAFHNTTSVVLAFPR
jgi:hypothetical protein